MTKGRVFWIIGVCLAILGIDVALKMYAHHNIAPMRWSSVMYPYGGIAIFQNFLGIDFSLNYVSNKGAAWGMFAGFQEYLLYFRFLIMGVIFVYLFNKKLSFFSRFALALILTGAIGNVIDFFVYGHVVDMFLFSFWGYLFPVFNIADSAIFCGVALLVLHSIFEKGPKNRTRIF
jgi:signal peptidase II